ncbi:MULTISPECIES: hypothetical protein [Enterococcus]|uniref:hypothetical protein n=1 Tax=Enterococcus TaxID=1350 RepID=UPI000A339115|nr:MULTISPECIES: hypothetical protein [unclassified Enterococcus]OTO71837.1 hypothetical protein A5865_002506 [Enterococcus sp. 12E11_DIV0728]OUZ15939.1 hypothetical protein A5868_000856 [Enterococcus sp. 12F9_DIV0723]
MFASLKRVHHRFELFIAENPKLSILLLIVTLSAVQGIVNFFRGAPLLSNLSYIFSLIWFYSIGLLASNFTKKKNGQFLICFLLSFITLILQSIFEKSLVDHTSVFLLAILALFIGSLSWLLTATLSSKRTRQENV